MQTVSPREVQKLASIIEEKDAVISLMNDDLYCFFCVSGYRIQKIFDQKELQICHLPLMQWDCAS